MKSAKISPHFLGVVEIVKSTQSNTSVSYRPSRATSRMGWVPETGSLTLSLWIAEKEPGCFTNCKGG